jgi:hypothetical protein
MTLNKIEISEKGEHISSDLFILWKDDSDPQLASDRADTWIQVLWVLVLVFLIMYTEYMCWTLITVYIDLTLN